MPISALDHIVLNVQDVERSLDFYSGCLGLAAERVEGWRRGDLPFPSIRINASTLIDLVKTDGATRQSATDNTNLAHFCLVTDDADLSQLASRLTGSRVPIEEGPAVRSGARGDALSIYFRDPDHNLIEVRTYARKPLVRFAIEDSQKRIRAAIQTLQDPDAPLEGNEGWSRKDLIAHLTSIEARFRTVTEAAVHGRPLGTETVDEFNTRAVAERRSWSLQELGDELDRESAAQLKLLQELNESDLTRIVQLPGGRPARSVADGWMILLSHTRRHLAELDTSRLTSARS